MTQEHRTARALPPLPLDEWEDTKETLHRYCQIAGKEGGAFSFDLDDLPVAQFYRRLFEGLASLGIHASINPKPFDLDDEHALDVNSYHCTCDENYVRRSHRVLAWVDQVFKEFAGRFNGKQSPVQLFWHSLDLAVTRFSGR